MRLIVDFHAHVFPEPLKNFELLSSAKVDRFRKKTRQWFTPISTSIHRIQAGIRHLPEFARKPLEGMSSLAPLPLLLVESTPNDLQEAMQGANVRAALIIAQPPHITNEFILQLAKKNQNLIPVVNIPRLTEKPGQALKGYLKQGARALKIHAAMDGEEEKSPRYRALLRVASDANLPVILHTGCFHSRILYRDSHQGDPRNFIKWYQSYPDTRFILAHMNLHEPGVALDLCEEFPNLFVDTSWQPAEAIGEAVRRIGADRVLFGTDWPLIGNNMLVGKQRVENCFETGLLNESQARLILGENAIRLLGLNLA